MLIMNNINIKAFYFLLGIILLSSCRPDIPVPKPRGYFRIDMPEKAYQEFDSTGFPYSFSYPVYGKITQDEELVKRENSPYWININFPDFNASVYLSYKEITPEEPFAQLMEESYRLTYAHDIRADYIRSPDFITSKGVMGIYYNVGGNAASTYQFLLTDTVKNFVRGSLYFEVTPNVDSLKPSLEFLKKDIDHLIETFEFK